MEEIVFWKEVDVKDELPPLNKILFVIDKLGVNYAISFNSVSEREYDINKNEITHWLKRVVVNILSDQEITDEAETIYPYDEDRMNKYDFENKRYQGIHFAAIKNYQEELLKAMQERLIGNNEKH